MNEKTVVGQHYKYGWADRLCDILFDAPWSSFDLMVSAILILRGVYLIFGVTMLERAYQLYRPLAGWFGLEFYGWLCLITGAAQLVAVLWPARPPFEIRLIVRMGGCFCFVVFFLNNMANSPPPIGAVTHFVLAMLSIWSVLRTSQSGG